MSSRGGIHIDAGALDPAALHAALGGPAGASGAVVVFTGVARGDLLGPGGERVVRLEFECYPPMAQIELERVRAEALERFPLHGLSIHHRYGSVPVGETIVAVGASAAHRQAAFAAAAWTMDQVKRRVPLWKKEVGSAGTERWVEGCHPDGH